MPEVEEKKTEEKRGGDARPQRDNRGGGPGSGPRSEGRGAGDRGGGGGDRGRDSRGASGGPRGPGGDRRPEGPPEIDIEKLISDSLYLDNQAHVVVSRMRDMDSGTKSQLRRAL